jgi:acyl dehydratase
VARRPVRHGDGPSVTLYANDIVPGTVSDLGHYQVGQQEMIDFALQWDPQGFHTDQDVASTGSFGGVIASGIHTLAILHRMSVLAVQRHWAVVAGVELRSVRFLAPVRPGANLRGTLRIDSVSIDTTRGRGLVTKTAWLEDGKLRVLQLTSDALVRLRESR